MAGPAIPTGSRIPARPGLALLEAQVGSEVLAQRGLGGFVCQGLRVEHVLRGEDLRSPVLEVQHELVRTGVDRAPGTRFAEHPLGLVEGRSTPEGVGHVDADPGEERGRQVEMLREVPDTPAGLEPAGGGEDG